MGYHGPRGELWLKPRSKPALHPDLNFSGMATLPRLPGELLTIIVDDGGKAWKMGLRNGDEILEMDGAPIPEKRAETERFVSLSRCVDSDAPIKVKVRRNGEDIEVERK